MSTKPLLALALLSVLVFPACAFAATLDVSPQLGSYAVGQTFSVSFKVTASETINAVSGSVSFPADRLQVVSIETSASPVSVWIQKPTFSNAAGTIEFSGIMLNPGFSGTGSVMTVSFRVRAAGSGEVRYSAGSVLANDGNGTNVLKGFSSGFYTFRVDASGAGTQPTPAPGAASGWRLVSSTHPEEGAWYNLPTATFSWDNPAGTQALNYAFGPVGSALDTVRRETTDSATFNVRGYTDGTYQFLIRALTAQGMTAIAKRVVRIDQTPPRIQRFERVDDNDDDAPGAEDPTPRLAWSVDDVSSGLGSLEVNVDSGPWTQLSIVEHEYRLTPQQPGPHLVTLRATDLAGNTQTQTLPVSVTPITGPSVTDATYVEGTGSADVGGRNAVIVSGTGVPGARIRVRLTKEDDVREADTIVNDRGAWALAYRAQLPAGDWLVQAQLANAEGALSEWVDGPALHVRGFLGQLSPTQGLMLLIAFVILASAGGAYLGFWLIRRRAFARGVMVG